MQSLKPALALVALSVGLAWTSQSHAFDHPGLDDFYARTATRSQGLTPCESWCDGEYVLRFLFGAQVANPSTDRLRPRLAEGLRLGGDAGLTLNEWSITRTRAWADWLCLGEEVIREFRE